MARPMVSLPALYAAQLPGTLEVAADFHREVLAQGAHFIERRKYSARVDETTFAYHRINVWRDHDGSYLFAFGSLAARQKAWDLFNAERAWRCLRGEVRLTELALYSVTPTERSTRWQNDSQSR